jgi:hypothetical protein
MTTSLVFHSEVVPEVLQVVEQPRPTECPFLGTEIRNYTERMSSRFDSDDDACVELVNSVPNSEL